MLKPTSRHRILEYIESKDQPTNTAEISRALKMTPANARHHLGLLVKDGRVSVVGQIPSNRRGRPLLLYSPATRAASHNLDGLAHALLTVMLTHVSIENQPVLLVEIATRLLTDPKPLAGSLAQRLTHAVHQLDELNYAARWEARSDAPHIMLGHCPYVAILANHPEICQLDALVLQTALGLPVSQQTKRERDSRGLLCCLFIVGKSRTTAHSKAET